MEPIFELRLTEKLKHLETQPEVKKWLKEVEEKIHSFMGVP